MTTYDIPNDLKYSALFLFKLKVNSSHVYSKMSHLIFIAYAPYLVMAAFCHDEVHRWRRCLTMRITVEKKKVKGRVLAIALTRELVTRSALQSRKLQLIGMS